MAYRYNFLSDKKVITTVLVDSIQLQGNDTVYYLNRIAKNCDTCIHLPNVNSPGFYLLSNQPQFLQRICIKTDSSYIFNDTLCFRICSDNTINKSWIFDTSRNITAKIENILNYSFLGTNDSIKTITLSTGDTILLSKNYGIISFNLFNSYGYGYTLAGIEGKDIGLQIPDAKEIYDFNVGDVFQYEGGNGSLPYPFSYISKETITSKTLKPDTIIYHIKKLGIKYNHYYGPYQEKFSREYDEIINLKNNYADFYNFNLYKSKNCLYGMFNVMTVKEENGEILKKPLLYLECYFQDTFNRYLYKRSFSCQDYFVYRKGLGMDSVSFWEFETSYRYHLIGYVKNGDTTGTVYSDKYLGMNTNQLENQVVFLFPNPNSGRFFIRFPEEYKNCVVQIYDLLGNELLEIEDYKSNNLICIPFKQRGLYLARVIIENENYTFKFGVDE